MAAVLFDILKFVRELRFSSSQEQAKALAIAVAAGVQDTVATKAGLDERKAKMKGDIAALKGDIAALRAERVPFKVDLVRRIETAIASNFVATAGFFVTAPRVFR